MALTTYANLVDAVRDWLGRANDTVYLTDTRIADFIRLGEADIYERLRLREMESSTAITVDDPTESIITDLIGVRRMYLDASPIVELEYLSPPQFWGTFTDGATGKPWAYTMEGDDFVWGPSPDATYTVRCLYWRRLPALSLGFTNNLYVRQPDLFLYSALAHACVFTQDDERLATFKQAFVEAMDRAMLSNERGRYGGAPIQMRPG